MWQVITSFAKGHPSVHIQGYKKHCHEYVQDSYRLLGARQPLKIKKLTLIFKP